VSRPYLRTKTKHLALPNTGKNIARCFLEDLLDGTIKVSSSNFVCDGNGNLIFLEYTEPHMLDVTGVLDSTESLQSLLNPTRFNSSIVPSFGKTRVVVNLPNGADLRVSAPLHIYDPIHLNMNGSRIFTETVDTDLLVIHNSAPRTRISNGEWFHAIPGVQLTDNNKTAIKIEAPQIIIDHVRIYGCGYGILIDSGVEQYNLNACQFYDVEITCFRRDGIKVKGIDASGHVWVGVTFFVGQNHFNATNGFGPAVGLRDECANGVASFGTRWELTGAPGISMAMVHNPPGGQAPSTHVAAYIEAGDPVSFGVNSVNPMAIGGHLALRQDWTKDRLGSGSSKLRFAASDSNGVVYSMSIPAVEYLAVMAFGSGVTADDSWLLKRERPDANTYRWVIQHYLNQGTDALGVQAIETSPDTWDIDSILISQASGAEIAVNGIYISINETNPSVALGYGTWIRFANGRCLIGVDETDTPVNAPLLEIGAKTSVSTGSINAQTFTGQPFSSVIDHTHTINITDSGHTHIQNSHNHTQDPHTHIQTAHNHGLSEGQTDGAGSFMDRSNAASATTAVTDNATAVNQNATATNQIATAVNQSSTTGITANSTSPVGSVPTVTPDGSVSQANFTGDAQSILQPSITVYFWLRTA
jgi:hypothetical protein